MEARMPWGFPRFLAIPSRALAPRLAACWGVEGIPGSCLGSPEGIVTVGFGIVRSGLGYGGSREGLGLRALAVLMLVLLLVLVVHPGAIPVAGDRASHRS